MKKYKKAVFVPALFLIRTDLTMTHLNSAEHFPFNKIDKFRDVKSIRNVTKKVNVEKYMFSPAETDLIKKYRDKQNNGRLKVRFIAFLTHFAV